VDWFERITGFREEGYEATRQQLVVEGGRLVSRIDGRSWGIGRLGTPTLAQLRERARGLPEGAARTTVRCVAADVRALHVEPALTGALFQVASQFNLLEMASPDVTPEHGVTRYMHDPTQGPACAIAAGAGTIYRNYLVQFAGGSGQTARRQIDTLSALGRALATRLGCPARSLWTMRNGYAMCSEAGLSAIGRLLGEADDALRDALRGELAIGLQEDVEVTDEGPGHGQRVTQAYGSALPVAYMGHAPEQWEPFARLVLEAAYEATLLAARLRAAAGGSRTVLLTRLGGGAFGNDDDWIDDAMERALRAVERAGLDVTLVSYREVHPSMRSIEWRWDPPSLDLARRKE